MRRHPPLRATYALFLKSSNFSPLEPVTSHSEYVGGDRPLYLGGSPKNLRWKGRLCVLGGEVGGSWV